MLLPRRYRNIILKLCVILPCLWLLVTLLIHSDHSKSDSSQKKPHAERLKSENLANSLDSLDKKSREYEDFQDEVYRPQKPPKDAVEGPGVLVPPHDPEGPGEMGKPVKVENPSKEVKKKIDSGWTDNAFNQYVSDMISVHRTLPDPRYVNSKQSRNVDRHPLGTTGVRPRGGTVTICRPPAWWSASITRPGQSS